MKKVNRCLSILLALALVIGLIPVLSNQVSAATNVYPMWQDGDSDGYSEIRCTYYAWQQVYDTLGVAMPNWGNAGSWYANASAAGYAVGSTPKVNSVAVWKSGSYGHVAFVTGISGDKIIVNEGGRADRDGWVNGKAGTDSDGVLHGSTSPSAVGSVRYGTDTLLGYIYFDGAPELTLTWKDYPEKHSIGTTNAVLAGWCDLSVDVSAVGMVGIYLYDYNGIYLTHKHENISYSGFNWINMWYDVNNELGCTLQPGTPYQYLLFVFINGQSHYSPMYHFTTNGEHTHILNAGVVTQEPTCSAEGVKTYTCTTCGATETESIPALQHSFDEGVITQEPTCGEWGAKTYTCTVCGEVYAEGISNDGISHTYDQGEYIQKPSCESDGLITYTCTVCGDSYTEIVYQTGHTWDGNTCTVCGEVRVVEPEKDENLTFLQAPGLSFQDYIGMQVLLPANKAEGYDKVYVKAIQQTPNGAVETTLQGTPYFGAYLIFEQQVLSWSMTENVSLTLYGEKDGVVYEGATVSTSVKALAMDKLRDYYADVNIKACRALVDMMNYGAAVQKAFSYNTESLPNADLGNYGDLASMGVPVMNAANEKTGTASVAVLKDSISMQAKVEIQLLFNTDISDYSVQATVGGTDASVVLDTESMGAYGWTVLKVSVGAAHMRDTYTIALYDEAGNAVTQIYNVSVEAYAREQLGGTYNDVVVAMMRYGDAVSAI